MSHSHLFRSNSDFDTEDLNEIDVDAFGNARSPGGTGLQWNSIGIGSTTPRKGQTTSNLFVKIVDGAPNAMYSKLGRFKGKLSSNTCHYCHKTFQLHGRRRKTFCRKCGEAVCAIECSEKTYWALLHRKPQRTCQECIAAAKAASVNFIAGQTPQLPVMIIPGFASSQLVVNKSKHKKSWIGRSIWVTLERLLQKKIAITRKRSSAPSPTHRASDEDDKNVFNRGSESRINRDGIEKVFKAFHGSNTRSKSGRFTVTKQSSFRVVREATHVALAKAHPLVRHLTLGPDGWSDPPGQWFWRLLWLSKDFHLIQYFFCIL